MKRVIILRLAAAVPLFILATFLVFGMMHIGTGTVSADILGDNATPEAIAAKDAELGLDRPFIVQYADWLSSAAQGDFGNSYRTGRSVTNAIKGSFPITLSVAFGGLLFGVVTGILGGVWAAVRPGSWVDRVISTGTSFLMAIPAFWFAMLLSFYVGVKLGWLPAIGYTPLTQSPTEWFLRLIMPSIALGAASTAVIARQMRGSLIDVLQRDYIRTARAKGASGRRIVFRHGLKNALSPVLTIIGFQAAAMIGGSLVVEQVFALPGLSKILIPAVLFSDIPVVLAVVTVTALVILLINLIVDLSYAIVDPKVRIA